MKEFLIGLTFLALAVILSGVGMLLYYLLMPVLGVLLYLALIAVFSIFAIWLLGKLIITVWEWMRTKKDVK